MHHSALRPAGALAATLLLTGCAASHSSGTPSSTPPDATPVPAAEEEPIRDQCGDGEQAWFDCATDDGAWLSVCGPAGEAAATSWLQLRHGPPLVATALAPAAPAGLDGLGWESSETSLGVLRAVHFGDGALVYTALPGADGGEPRAGAVLPGGAEVTCRADTVEDTLPDVGASLPAPAAPLSAGGTLAALQNGDAACYVVVEGRFGRVNHYGEFDLCQSAEALIGAEVALEFVVGRVIAPSCQGDPECADSIEVPLVSAILAR